MLESGDPAACLRLHRLPRLMPELFQATGRGQLAMRVNLLLDTTMVQFDALLALSDYTDGVSLEAEMTAPELSAVF